MCGHAPHHGCKNILLHFADFLLFLVETIKKRDILSEKRDGAKQSVSLRPKAVMLTPMVYKVPQLLFLTRQNRPKSYPNAATFVEHQLLCRPYRLLESGAIFQYSKEYRSEKCPKLENFQYELMANLPRIHCPTYVEYSITPIFRERIFSREDIFAGRYFRGKIFSREQYIRENKVLYSIMECFSKLFGTVRLWHH